MKRERAEHQDQSNTMLSKLQPHKFQNHSQPSQPPHLRHTSAPSSEEADSHSPTHHPARRVAKDDDVGGGGSFLPPPPQQTNDGATIEVVRRPRGRPPGSKNKPKPPVVITRDVSEPSMSPYVLELPAGVDLIESTTRFCRKRSMGLCILNGNGVVANVTLKQPSATPGATVTFHGRFDILSISATILPGGGMATGNGPFCISLAGPQGQVVGGIVVGPLLSAGTVYLIAATFNSPSFERLQQAPDEDEAVERGGSGHDQREAVSAGDSGGAHPMYSYQPSDVIWAPTARQPPPPPPHY
ncbi:hypothetical protein CDL12_01228 [Handroanthus impetiginosus]|uniref:AT-hook motif nuclear-localized protein n=1 Tax=Handroanthus impetiginosus TaxID=429701 RepID=A0A2G9I8G0_9LAMI|nr:hypothetical protein CDL12_01228 [Handroanthus impetiginosus]